MRPLTPTELLQIWERDAGRPPLQRALDLLAAACPELSVDELARLSIGRRDACLLTLRAWAFGPQLACLATCPACGQRLELDLDAAALLAAAPEAHAAPLELRVADAIVLVRPPDSFDLAAIDGCVDLDAARDLLLARCVAVVTQNGTPTPLSDAPEAVIAAAEQALDEADPLANVELALNCPACGHAWPAAFDIVTFFWTEIDAWVHQILREIHVLAAAYGWREADILAMGPQRRQIYLELAGT